MFNAIRLRPCGPRGFQPKQRHAVAAALLFLGLLGIFALAAEGAKPAGKKPAGNKKSELSDALIHEYRSKHFLIHTDLDALEAKELLKKLETEMRLIGGYWGRPAQGVIECWIAKDLKNWSDELQKKMEPEGLAKIREGAGVCITHIVSKGGRFRGTAHMYAVSKQDVPLHEAVHGYCGQTFGHTGPHWYAEGMAEMGHYWIEGQKGVHVPPIVIKYMKKTKPRQLESLIANDAGLGGTWEDYCWWWFLCHLLENDDNYSGQFRLLGRNILVKNEKITFQDVFGAHIKELDFEFRFFLEHLENGYRVDLCSWNWKRHFSTRDKNGHPIQVNIQAGRGWQPSGLTVSEGAKYAFKAEDEWTIGENEEAVGANGNAKGDGRLVGVVMKDYQLGKEFELGAKGTLTAPGNGDLYLRCRVPWAKIAENSGKMTVELKAKD
jgi:hypothetical protein